MITRVRDNVSRPTSIRIPHEVLEPLDREAERQDVTRTWLIVRILQEWLASQRA